MNAFIEIAEQQNTNLAVVAPGIAEALLATGLGLLAAIPAVVFYNKLSADSDRIVAGTYIILAAMLNCKFEVKNFNTDHILSLIKILKKDREARQ